MEPESPIGDLFQECETCVNFSQESSELQKSLAAHSARILELKEQIQSLEPDSSKRGKLESQLEKIEEKSESVRQGIRSELSTKANFILRIS